MAKAQNSTMMDKDNSSISLYLKEINAIPLLTREEEIDLATKAANGDKTAKDKIVKANLRFVVNVAKQYQNRGLDLLDLISEGNIGLLTAIDRFDISKGYHFISYAVWWIRQSILKAIYEKSRMIRLPLNRANELVQIEKAKRMIKSQDTEEQELATVARMLNMEPSHVRDMIQISREMISLDASVKQGDADSSSVGDFVEDTRYENPEQTMINENMKSEINKVLDTLTEKEAAVLRCRFGLNGKKGMSLKEVGDVFSLTKERIRQIEKKAIKRLQHPARIERLEAFVA